MRLVARIVLFTAVLLPACILAADTGSMGNVVLVRVPNGGQAVAAKITEGGTMHLLYNSGDIPYYVKSPDGGGSFSSPIAVVDKASRKPGLVFSGMSMAVGKGNTVYVAMITNNWQIKLPDVPDGLIYATLALGAKAFTPVRSLNRRPSEGFSLAADGNGDVAASWLAGRLFANFSRDVTAEPSPPTLRSTIPTCPASAVRPARFTPQTGTSRCSTGSEPTTSEICM